MAALAETVVADVVRASCGSTALLDQAVVPALRERPMWELFDIVKNLGDAPVVFENARGMTYADALRRAAEHVVREKAMKRLMDRKSKGEKIEDEPDAV